MNINKEQIDDLNMVVSVEIGKDDYEPKVNEILRDYRRKANMPGFRPGKVPEGLIRKMYGKAVLIDEINKLVTESLQKYVEEQGLKTLGNPLPVAKEEDLEWEIGNDYTFDFEMGLAPVIDINLSKEDQLVKYRITIDREQIDSEIEKYAGRFGRFTDVDAVTEFNEKITGDIVQLGEDAQPLPDGLSAEDASMLAALIKDEESKKPFENAKAGDEIVFNLSNTFPNEWEIASILKKKDKNEIGDISESQFKFTVKTVQKYVNAEINQELFDKAFGEGVVADLEDFENRIKNSIASDLEESCNSKFSLDMRDYLMQKFDPSLPENFLRKCFKSANDEVVEEDFDREFPQVLENMKWELIADAVIRQYELKVDEQEIIEAAKAAARRQFSMYGLKNIADEYLSQYAMSMLKDEKSVRSMASQALERKIARTVIEFADVSIQEVSVEEFEELIKPVVEEVVGEVEEAEIAKTEEAGTVEVVENPVKEVTEITKKSKKESKEKE
jgi:trigger factor